MDTNNLTVAGRRFRTRAEYEAALRDEQKINEIKSRYTLHNKDDVRELFGELQAGMYSFESALGNDFDDEVFDLMEKFKSAPDSVGAGAGRKRSGKKTGNIGNASKNHTAQSHNAGKGRNAGKDQDNGKGDNSGKGNREAGKGKVLLESYDTDMQNEILAVIRKKEKRRNRIVAGCTILAIASFAYFGIYYFFAARTDQDAQDLGELRKPGMMGTIFPQDSITVHKTGEIAVPDILEEYITLYNMNKRLIGWLKIDDTIIDYPVLQTTDNEYYLDHNFDQEYDRNGSIFMDYQCTLYPRSTNLIIYGHHMKSGKMFGSLQQYAKESYYQEHPIVQFDTIYEKGTYEIMYAFRSKVYNENEIVFKYYQFFQANSEEEFDSHMKEMARMSLYDTGVTANYGDQLLTLSTCDNSQSDGRFVVVAKRVS